MNYYYNTVHWFIVKNKGPTTPTSTCITRLGSPLLLLLLGYKVITCVTMYTIQDHVTNILKASEKYLTNL